MLALTKGRLLKMQRPVCAHAQPMLPGNARRMRGLEMWNVHRRAAIVTQAVAHVPSTGRALTASVTAAAATPQQAAQAPAAVQLRGKDVVMAFYDAYNRRDLAAIEALIADDISYHDLVYPEPHEGRAGVMSWLTEVRRYAPDDLLFVIDDITQGDDTRVGVMWHVECGGVFFPYSRGCSFIQLNSNNQIVGVRDVVEGSSKPGDATLRLLGVLAPAVRRGGPAAGPDPLARAPLAAAGVWALYAAYIGVVLLSDLVPGPSALSTPPEVFDELLQESLNLWWINDALTAAGIGIVHTRPCHPVSEALFNFVVAWAMLLVPVMLTDGAAQKVKNKPAWAVGVLFLTNVFAFPFMALRAAPEPQQLEGQPGQLEGQDQRRPAPPGSQAVPGWARGVGAAGGALGVLCIAWAFAGRPELGGDLAARSAFFAETAGSNRVFWAFVLDCGIFYVWQLWLLAAAPEKYRLVPFFGLAGWLLQGGGTMNASSETK